MISLHFTGKTCHLFLFLKIDGVVKPVLFSFLRFLGFKIAFFILEIMAPLVGFSGWHSPKPALRPAGEAAQERL